MADLEEIRSRLEAVGEDLADVALDRLREAAAGRGRGGEQVEERLITRARRAVERAVHLLQQAEGGAGADPEPSQDW
jgi:hypothetical protein